MSEIEVVVDVRPSPDSNELIVVKQKLTVSGELRPSGPPMETRIDPYSEPREALKRFQDQLRFLLGTDVVFKPGVQAIFDTMPEPLQIEVARSLAVLRSASPERWPSDKLRLMDRMSPPVYALHVNPELIVLVNPTAPHKLEVVDIIRTATLEQFDSSKVGGGGAGSRVGGGDAA
jgi:hypothetical protein